MAFNENWYTRLMDKVRTDTSRSIRKTGSEANDPFWKAREAQGIGDVQLQRDEALRALQDRMLASRRPQAGTSPGAFFGGSSAPNTYMTATGGNEPGGGSVAPGQAQSAPQSPAAYRLPMSGMPAGPAFRAPGGPVPVNVNPANWAARMAPGGQSGITGAPPAGPAGPAGPKKGVLSPQEELQQKMAFNLQSNTSYMGEPNRSVEAFNMLQGRSGAGLSGGTFDLPSGGPMGQLGGAGQLRKYQEALVKGLATKDIVATEGAAAKTVTAKAAKTRATAAVTAAEAAQTRAGAAVTAAEARKRKLLGGGIPTPLGEGDKTEGENWLTKVLKSRIGSVLSGGAGGMSNAAALKEKERIEALQQGRTPTARPGERKQLVRLSISGKIALFDPETKKFVRWE